jgi:hypothetical protein
VHDEPGPAARRARLGHAVGRFLFFVLYAARRSGGDNVPSAGPVVLAANHTGYLDGALVVSMAPRPSHFLVLSRMFEGPVGHVLRWSGQPRSSRAGVTGEPWARRWRCSDEAGSSASSRRAVGGGGTSPRRERVLRGSRSSPGRRSCPPPAWAPAAPGSWRDRGPG